MRPRHLWWAACVALAMTGTGCGDDDGGTPTDAGGREDTGPGPRDAGVDSGTTLRDAGMDAGRPPVVPACDIFAADPGCGADEKCSVILNVISEDDVEVLFGCVPTSLGTKDVGVPCARFGRDATPGDTTDDVRTDDCASGLFCWTSGSVNTCQPVCGDDRVECETAEYCGLLNSEPQFGTCSAADDCDPVFQTGCGAGEGCYLVANTLGDLLASCFEFSPPDGGTGAPGATCRFINDCAPGGQCFPEYYPDGGTSTTVSCKSLCAAGGAPDGGTPMDGGITGDCTAALTCVAIPLEDGTIMVSTVPGICQ